MQFIFKEHLLLESYHYVTCTGVTCKYFKRITNTSWTIIALLFFFLLTKAPKLQTPSLGWVRRSINQANEVGLKGLSNVITKSIINLWRISFKFNIPYLCYQVRDLSHVDLVVYFLFCLEACYCFDFQANYHLIKEIWYV